MAGKNFKKANVVEKNKFDGHVFFVTIAVMFIRPLFRKSKKSNGKKIAYWALVESYRAERGPRQRVVAYLGQVGDEEILRPQALGLQYAAQGKTPPQFVQTRFSCHENEKNIKPQWVEIDVKNVKLENQKLIGGPCPNCEF